jgi:DNA polymerase-3 subunit epsilon
MSNIGSTSVRLPELDLFNPAAPRVHAGDYASQSRLRSDAAALLLSQPLSSVRLIEQVCRMPGVPSAVADEMAAALFGASPWFRRSTDGIWSLATELEPTAPPMSASTSLDELSYLVVDVETTGHSPYTGHRMTEVAAYQLEGGHISCVIDTLLNPQRPIPRFVTALTGISWRMVKDAPLFEEHAARLAEAMEGRIFVAHNVNFDWKFVATEMEWATGVRPVHDRLCTVKMARSLIPGLPRRSLDRVADYFGIAIEARHRAGGDAFATARILQRLLDRAGERGIRTWGELNEYSSRRKGKRRARGPRAGRGGPGTNAVR